MRLDVPLLDTEGLSVVARYFAYGSNMNPDRVRERGIGFGHACGARLSGYALAFDKTSRHHEGVGHANLIFSPGSRVEGVLYWLHSSSEIEKMDRFESAPVNYSREVIHVEIDITEVPEGHDHLTRPSDRGTLVHTWTYFANPAVRRPDLLPPRSYLNHLLAGERFLSADYFTMLKDWPCEETR
jgi:cation transport regulator ChaC